MQTWFKNIPMWITNWELMWWMEWCSWGLGTVRARIHRFTLTMLLFLPSFPPQWFQGHCDRVHISFPSLGRLHQLWVLVWAALSRTPDTYIFLYILCQWEYGDESRWRWGSPVQGPRWPPLSHPPLSDGLVQISSTHYHHVQEIPEWTFVFCRLWHLTKDLFSLKITAAIQKPKSRQLPDRVQF